MLVYVNYKGFEKCVYEIKRNFVLLSYEATIGDSETNYILKF